MLKNAFQPDCVAVFTRCCASDSAIHRGFPVTRQEAMGCIAGDACWVIAIEILDRWLYAINRDALVVLRLIVDRRLGCASDSEKPNAYRLSGCAAPPGEPGKRCKRNQSLLRTSGDLAPEDFYFDSGNPTKPHLLISGSTATPGPRER